MNLFFSISCKKTNENEKLSVEQIAYYYIDQNRSEEAIKFLYGEIKKYLLKPSLTIEEKMVLDNLYVILASAYAKLSDFSVLRITNAISIGKKITEIDNFNDEKMIQKSSNNIEIKSKSKINNNDEILNDFSKIFIFNFKYYHLFKVIPKVEENNIVYLKYSVKILNSIENLKRPDLIFRALLKIVLAISVFEINYLKFEVSNDILDPNYCKIDLNFYSQNLINTLDEIKSAMQDLLISLPEKKNELSEIIAKLDYYKIYLALQTNQTFEINKQNSIPSTFVNEYIPAKNFNKCLL